MSVRTAKNPRRGKFGRSAFFHDRSSERLRRTYARISNWRERFPEDAGVWYTVPGPWKTSGRIQRQSRR